MCIAPPFVLNPLFEFPLTAFWELVCPTSVVETGSPGLSEEDETGLTLEGDVFAGIKELLGAKGRTVGGTTGEATILAWKWKRFGFKCVCTILEAIWCVRPWNHLINYPLSLQTLLSFLSPSLYSTVHPSLARSDLSIINLVFPLF